MQELHSIKDRLTNDGCPINLNVIKKALFLPEEEVRNPSSFVYPNPKLSLMVNPFPKVIKKKKKKGKK
jgi:hypothetical protein